jgi:hypothetical protein
MLKSKQLLSFFRSYNWRWVLGLGNKCYHCIGDSLELNTSIFLFLDGLILLQTRLNLNSSFKAPGSFYWHSKSIPFQNTWRLGRSRLPALFCDRLFTVESKREQHASSNDTWSKRSYCDAFNVNAGFCHSVDGSNKVHTAAVHIGPPTAELEVWKKVKLSRNRPWRPIGLWDVKDPTLSRQSAHS